jgi:hypothetical protein
MIQTIPDDTGIYLQYTYKTTIDASSTDLDATKLNDNVGKTLNLGSRR